MSELRDLLGGGGFEPIGPDVDEVLDAQPEAHGWEVVPTERPDLGKAWKQVLDANPDEVAERGKLAGELDVDPALASDMDLNHMRQASEFSTQSTALDDEAPTLALWATNPQNLVLAKDDLGNLRMIESEIRQGYRSPMEKAIGALEALRNQGVLIFPRMAKALNEGIAMLGTTVEGTAQSAEDLLGWDPILGHWQDIGRDIREYGLANASTLKNDVMGNPKLQVDPTIQGKRLWDNPELIYDPEWMANNFGEAAGSMLPIMAAYSVGGPQAASFVGGLMEGGDLYGELESEGVESGRAASAAMAFGMVTGALNKLGLEAVLSKASSQKLISRVAKGFASGSVEGVTEWGEEPFQALFGELARGKSWTEVAGAIGDAAKNIDVMPGAFLMGGGTNFMQETAAAVQKQKIDDLKEYLDKLSKLSAMSTLAGRDQARFVDFLDRVSAETGFTQVHVDAEAVRSYAQELGVDADAWIEDMGVDFREVAEAAAATGTLPLSVSKVVSNLGEDPILQALVPHMRRDPADMSEATIDEEVADEREKQALIQEMYQAELVRMAAPETLRTLRAEIEALGFTPDQAKVKTMLLEHRANTWAQHSGRSASEWFEAKGLRFERGQDEQTAETTPSIDSKITETTLPVLEAIEPLAASWERAMPVTVVETEAELPEQLRTAHRGTDPIKAIRTEDQVWLVAGNIEDAEQARALWRHEQGLHHGIRGLFGVVENVDGATEALDTFLDGVFETFGEESFWPYIKPYGLDFSKAEDRRIAAEERLARIAERLEAGEEIDQADQGVWDSFVEFVREMARELGVDLQLSDAEIVGTVRRSMRWAEGEGKGRSYGQPVNPGVDLEQELEIIDIEPQFFGQNPLVLRKRFPKAVLRKLAEGGPVQNPDLGEIQMTMNGVKHALGRAVGDPAKVAARLEIIPHLREVVEKAVLVESHADRKGQREVVAIHRLYAPVQIGNYLHAVRVTVKETSEGGKHKAVVDSLKFYSSAVDKTLPAGTSPARPEATPGPTTGNVADLPTGTSSARQKTIPRPTANKSIIRLRTLLEGVKGADGQNYAQSSATSDRADILFKESETVVRLFGQGNLSSILHENGHLFLEDLAEGAAQGIEVDIFEDAKAWFSKNAAQVLDEIEANEQALKRQYNEATGEQREALARELGSLTEALSIIKRRGGVEYIASTARGLTSFKTSDAADAVVLARYHEMFARGFEAYLREGKAPDVKLQNAFVRFRQWLVRIYRSVRDLRVELDDGIRSVFDRLLATDQQIETARTVCGAVRMFEGNDIQGGGFSNADMEEYQRLANEARAQAAARLDREKNRDRNKRLRQWREEIKAEVAERQGFKALDWLMGKKGKPGAGLNKADFLVRYSTADIERLPRGILKDDGLPLDLAAAESGYETADDMMQDIFDTRSQREVVDELLAQREAAHDAQFDPNQAIHSGDFARLLELESQILARKAGSGVGRAMQARGLRAWAENVTNKELVTKAQDVYRLLAEAKRQRVRAIRAQRNGNYEYAYRANERLRKIEALLSARFKARQEVPFILRRLKRLAQRKTIDKAFLEQIFGVLHRYELGSPSMQAAKEGRKPLFRFMAPGDDAVMDARPDFPDWLLGEKRGGHWRKSFTMEDLRDVDRLVRYLAKRGAEAADEAVSRENARISVRAAQQAKPMKDMKDKKVWDQGSVMRTLTAPGRKFLPEFTNQIYMMKAADGYSNQGPTGVVGPNEEMAQWIVNASNEEKRLWAEFAPAMQPMLDHFSRRISEMPKKLNVGIDITEGMKQHGVTSWNMEMVFAAALNCGNDGNLLAIVDGYELVDEEEVSKAMKDCAPMSKEEYKQRINEFKIARGWERLAPMFELMTEQDWDTVQATWDLIDKAFPLIDKTYRKFNGIGMKKVPARPFLVPGSGKRARLQLSGGYYPLVFDSRFADNVKTWNEVEDWLDGEGQFQTPAARSNFVRERVGGRLPPRLELSVIFSHLQDTLHYATHAAVLKDADRITRDPAWANEYKRVFGVDAYAQVRPWLKGIARRERPPVGNFHSMVEEHRRLATIAILGLNASVALKQPFSLFGAATEMGWGALASGVGQIVTHRGELINQINELSPYMAQRGQAWDREVQAALNRSSVHRKSVWIKGKEYSWRDVQDGSFILIRIMDAAAVYPIWAGAHAKAQSQGMNPDQAVDYADMIVRDTQPSADAIDLAAWQRGHGIYRLFSMFMTFTLKFGQRQRYYIGGWRQGKISTRRMLRHVAYEWILPSLVMSNFLSLLRTGEPPEPEEMLMEMIGYQVCGYPIVNQIMGAVQYNRGMMETPAARGVDILWNAAKKTFDATQGEVDERTFWALAEALSYSAGLPVSKVVRTAVQGLDSDNPFNLIMTNPKRRR